MMGTQQVQTALGEGIRTFNNVGALGDPKVLMEFWAGLPEEMKAWLVDNSVDSLGKVRAANVEQHEGVLKRIDAMIAEQEAVDGYEPAEIRAVAVCGPFDQVVGHIGPDARAAADAQETGGTDFPE